MQVKVDHESRIDVSELFRPAILPTDGAPDLQLLVAGEWRAAAKGEMFEVRSPIDGNLIARAAKASRDDVEEAIAAARQARDGFRGLPAAARLEICARAAEILEEHAESFISAIVADLGKTTEQAASEVKATRERLGLAREEVRKIFGEYLPGDWIADSVGKSAVVLREPVGTVAAFGPFNYPLYLALAASKIIPALAAGNTVVAKAPSEAPIPLVLFGRVFEEAGLPPGVLNVITGPGSEIGNVLASHVDVSMISFTGSTSVGRSIAAGPDPSPCISSSGATPPASSWPTPISIVLSRSRCWERSRTPASAPSAVTPSSSVPSKRRRGGSWSSRSTTTTSSVPSKRRRGGRWGIPESRRPRSAPWSARRPQRGCTNWWRTPSTRAPGCSQGVASRAPITSPPCWPMSPSKPTSSGRRPSGRCSPFSQKAAAWVHELVEDAVNKGARLLAGGGVSGAYHEPTVLADVPVEADIVWEETFGPVLTILPVADREAAIDLANRSRYGLDSAVFTSNLESAWQTARALECGQVTINDAPAHGVGHFPFGGRKPDSGIGREGLGYSIDECTVLKTHVLSSLPTDRLGYAGASVAERGRRGVVGGPRRLRRAMVRAIDDSSMAVRCTTSRRPIR